MCGSFENAFLKWTFKNNSLVLIWEPNSFNSGCSARSKTVWCCIATRLRWEDKLLLPLLGLYGAKLLSGKCLNHPEHSVKPQRRAWWAAVGSMIEKCMLFRGMGLCWKVVDVKNTEDPPLNTHIHPSLFLPCLAPLHSLSPHPLNKLTHMLKDECPTNGGKVWVRDPYEKCIVQAGGASPPSPLRGQ